MISIIEDIVEKKLNIDVHLIYSNRTEEEIAFKKELDGWQAINSDIKVTHLISDYQPKDKTCVYGRIDKGLIKGRMPDLGERILFIFGPPKMVEAMKILSLELGASPENIKTEAFMGY